jgi:hypothetical protein
MHNNPKGLGFLSQRTHRAPSSGRRHRLTRATAKGQETGHLIDLFEKAVDFLAEAEAGQPMSIARAKRDRIILRNELLTRGFSEEALNGQPDQDDISAVG